MGKYYFDVLNYVNEAIYVLNEQDKIIFINQSFTKLFGYEEKDIINSHVHLMFDESELGRIEKKLLNRKEGITESY